VHNPGKAGTNLLRQARRAAETGLRGLNKRYTRNEVARILGVTSRQLHYWEKLHLVKPRARWGERFYSFGDLLAVETIKELTAKRVPALRLRRAVLAWERRRGQPALSLAGLRVSAHGRRLAVAPPELKGRPIDPLTGQMLLSFEPSAATKKILKMHSRTAEEWFELAVGCEGNAEELGEAVEAYRRAIELAPEWLEPRINLGVALYKLYRLEEAEECFRVAVTLDPQSSVAQFNLGCVLDEMGRRTTAIRHLRRAIRLAPSHADAHFNLALAYEKNGNVRGARKHWSAYLHYEPLGPWADYARSRLAQHGPAGRPNSPIPFRKNG
jgi:tetratricopeptide (TPR) repeat protein